MRKDQLKSLINKATEAHAIKILGEKQFKENKAALKGIIDDFRTGANWMYNLNTEPKDGK